MSNEDPEIASENWTEMIEGMNDAMSKSIEQNMQAQSAFIESWSKAFDGAAESAEATDESDVESMLTEGMEGYGRAYEVWMDAAERMAERVNDAAQGEDVSITEFRDIWLQSANEAFSEVMSTTAFAAGTGQTISQMMELQQQADDLTQDTLEGLGFATRGDIDEVGARLVELERRQHEVSSNQRETAGNIEGIADDVGELDENVRSVSERLDEVSNDQREAANDIAQVSEDVTEVSSGVAGLDERFDDIEGVADDVGELDENVRSVSERLDEVEERQQDISEKLDRLVDLAERSEAGEAASETGDTQTEEEQ